MKEQESKTPILDTYTVTRENCPQWPNVRRFIIPETRKIIENTAAPDGKIDMLIRIGMGGMPG